MSSPCVRAHATPPGAASSPHVCQVVAAPYIQDHAGDSPGLWLGMYYTAIPFGTCVGYGYGAILASSSLTWAAAFWLEALMMAPLMMVCFVLPRDIHKVMTIHLLVSEEEVRGGCVRMCAVFRSVLLLLLFTSSLFDVVLCDLPHVIPFFDF